METKAMVICGIAVFFALMEIVLTDDNNLDNTLSDEIQRQQQIDAANLNSFSGSQEDLHELMKKGTLLRFGKRGSLLRFGKRGSLLRFGKRGSLLRFGKRYDEDDVPSAVWIPSGYLDSDEPVENKRGSLLRFGKKAALFRYGRSADNGPHTPFRFGREEESVA